MEQIYTDALVAELDREQARRSMNQRAFAHFLGVHESLLSLYRSGQRFPSVPGFIELEQHLPNFMHSVVQGYYKLVREQQERERLEDEQIEHSA